MASGSKIKTPAEVNKIISAEIPDAQLNPKLFDVVSTFNIHGPCGQLCPTKECSLKPKDDGTCSKAYLRAYCKETSINSKLHYPLYRRQAPINGGRTLEKYVNGNKVIIDNRWVVPYSPILSEVFEAHINVEVVMSLGAVKYLYKYVTKGSDKVLFGIQDQHVVDEIENFQVGRFISATEAFWRIYQFKIHFKHPNVKKLPLHLPHQQLVYFNEDDIDEAAAQGEPKTELLAYFELNQTDPDARTILYPDIVKYYTWQPNSRTWKPRRNNLSASNSDWLSDSIGRIPVINLNPKKEELFYLRMCLHHIAGAQSFEDLRTVNGVLHGTYKEACVALGVLSDDKELGKVLETAASVSFGRDLRELFATILTHASPTNANELWENNKNIFVQDYIRQQGGIREITDNDYNMALLEIQDILDPFQLDLTANFGIGFDRSAAQTLESHYQTTFDVKTLEEITKQNREKFTAEQRAVFELIMKSVENASGRCFALDAPGGTGKTFLLTTVLAHIRSQEQTAIATAISGIAATLLSGGRTLHSTMKVPLDVDEFSTCGITPRD